MKSEIIGVSSTLQTLSTIPRENRMVLEKTLTALSLEYETKLKREINSGSRSGRVYKRKSVTHQASTAGEPPKTDTGQLVNSIHTRSGDNGLSAEVYSRLKYAMWLEFGTSKTAARPAWIPIFHGMKPKIKKLIARAVDKVIEANKSK